MTNIKTQLLFTFTLSPSSSGLMEFCSHHHDLALSSNGAGLSTFTTQRKYKISNTSHHLLLIMSWAKCDGYVLTGALAMVC